MDVANMTSKYMRIKGLLDDQEVALLKALLARTNSENYIIDYEDVTDYKSWDQGLINTEYRTRVWEVEFLYKIKAGDDNLTFAVIRRGIFCMM